MPEPHHIRPATAADLPALHALVQRAYRGEAARAGWTHEADLLGGQRTDVPMLAAALADPAHLLLIAEEGAALVGSVEIVAGAGGLASLGLLAVDPARQGGGLGRRLIVAAEEAARERGGTRIEMTVIRQRPELIAYYQRRGYRLTGETRPFPLDDPRFGLPTRRDLAFAVLEKPLG